MSLKNTIKKLTDKEEVLKTLEQVRKQGYISDELSDKIASELPNWIKDSEYVLFNLGIHMATAAFRFTFIPVPLPIGIILRDSWILGNKAYFKLQGNKEKAAVHSWKVLAVASIPFLGYFAYTIPLREKSEYLTYVYAEHISFMRKEKPLEEYLDGSPKIIRSLGYRLLVPNEIEKNKKLPPFTPSQVS